jgi:bla regulator protein BlaR1
MRDTGLAVLAGVLTIGVWGGALGWAQEIVHASGPLPVFEVATVKLMKPEVLIALSEGAATGGAGSAGGGAATVGGEKVVRETSVHMFYGEGPLTDRVHLRWKAKMLIEIAYGLPIGSELRVVGGPEWIDNDADRYEMQGKIDDATFAAMQTMPVAERNRQVNLMEQALLADRFALKVHFEKRQLPVYALVVAKGGPKLREAKPDEVARLTGTGNGQNNVLDAQALTLAQLVRSPLLRPGGRMVVDQTGLTGRYDFTLKSSSGDADATGPSLFTAMEEQLGLKLVSTKAPVEVIVVDHVERPGEN